MGIYYTPSYIVDYIVKNTVREYLREKTIDEILEVRIIDPACGSGSLLTRAYIEVCNAIEDRLIKGHKSKKYNSFNSYNNRLNLSQKATILTNCIYGVDLDEKAIELSRLNLLLKILEGEEEKSISQKLPNLANLKCGNSLIDDSSISDRAFNWEAQFPKVFEDGGFDIVVGNPPYVFARENISKEIKNFYSKYFQTAKYQLNTYLLFIEKTVKLLKKEGVLGFIVPDAWLKVESASTLRKFLLENTYLQKMIHIRGETFEGVGVESSILILKKTRELAKTEVSNNLELLNYVEFNQNDWLKSNNFEIDLFSNKKSIESLERLEKENVSLDEVTQIKAGLQAYEKGKGIPKQVALDVKNRPYDYNVKHDQNTHQYLEGKDIFRYSFKWNNSWLKYGVWLAAPRTFDLFSSPRILVREIPSKPPYSVIGVYLDKTFLNNRSIINILSKNVKIKLKYVLGILNSKLITFYHLNKSVKAQRDLFPKITLNDIRRFPIKISSELHQNKIIDLVDQAISLQNKFHDNKLSGNEKERLEQQIKNIDYEIDQEVYKLYGITKEEQKIIEESLK